MICTTCTANGGKGPWAEDGCVTFEKRSVEKHESSEIHKAAVAKATKPAKMDIAVQISTLDHDISLGLVSLFDIIYTTAHAEVIGHDFVLLILNLSVLQIANRKVNVFRDLVARNGGTTLNKLSARNAKYTSNDFIAVRLSCLRCTFRTYV